MLSDLFSNFIFSALAFFVALGVLISIHEFGHFWVARKMDVKVLKFSIGFGKAIWSRKGKVDGTEYALSMIPLGGYVRMLDEREGNVNPQEVHRAFNRKSVWARIAIVIAGPLANFILAVAVYWVVMLTGISGIAPLLGEIEPDSAAGRAGFQFEDKIVSINGETTPTWSDARIALLQNALEQRSDKVLIEVDSASGERLTRTLQIDSAAMLETSGDAVQELGISQWWPKVTPVIGGLQPDGAATQSGFQIGDLIVQANDEKIETWRAWVLAVRANPGQEMAVDILRDGNPMQILLTPGSKTAGGETFGFIGAWETQSAEQVNKIRVVVSYPLLESLQRGFQRTWDMSVLTLRMMVKLVTGQASLENISGPISIAKFAGQSASVGLDHYLNFLAIISISLGVLNLLPIPLLDGGHLLYYFIEILTGKPLPERVQMMGQQLGLMLLGGLMLLAFYNDIWRLAG